jgi:DNA modification methylase
MTLPVNQIVQGDCVQVLKTLPTASVDLVVTDPPYLVNYRNRSGQTIKNDNGGSAGVLAAPSGDMSGPPPTRRQVQHDRATRICRPPDRSRDDQ